MPATPPAGPAANMRIGVNMTPAESYDFFQKLATDDGFRSRLQANPQATLADYHIYYPPGQLPAQIKLPSKAVLKKAIASHGGVPPGGQAEADWVYVVWAAFLAFL